MEPLLELLLEPWRATSRPSLAFDALDVAPAVPRAFVRHIRFHFGLKLETDCTRGLWMRRHLESLSLLECEPESPRRVGRPVIGLARSSTAGRQAVPSGRAVRPSPPTTPTQACAWQWAGAWLRLSPAQPRARL